MQGRGGCALSRAVGARWSRNLVWEGRWAPERLAAFRIELGAVWVVKIH